jgi:uncharacterized protein (TIGR02001 family)
MKTVTSLLLGTTLLATSFASTAEVTANVAASSNYFWRGVTQTQDAAAVSGGIDYSNDSGFYAGTWVSNVDFGNKTSYEMDFYAGFSGEAGAIGYDVGYVYYAYPDAEGSSDFGELYGEISYEWLSAKVSYLSNAQNDASSEEDMLYLELNAAFSVFTDTELGLHLGRSSGDTVTEWFAEDDSYMDYGVSLSKDGFTLGLVKTDLKADDDIKAYVSYGIDFSL